jgi:hypothetical protein
MELIFWEGLRSFIPFHIVYIIFTLYLWIYGMEKKKI